jgi:hypothetical protein
VESETPADFVGHPVPDAGAGVLIEKKSLEGFVGMAREKISYSGEGKSGVLRLRGEIGPGIGLVVEHDSTEHPVVVEDEGSLLGAEDEVVVLVKRVIRRRGHELAGHAEMDFEVECGSEGEKQALAVRTRSLEREPLQNPEGGSRAITVDPGCRVSFQSNNAISVERGPLASSQFDFGKFGHGGTIRAIGEFGIGIWHGMRLGSGGGRSRDETDGGE